MENKSLPPSAGDMVVALAGNPNVGKSTLFNALTGMNQHTGNWPGKTVATAQGRCRRGADGFLLVDLPGTYSLLAHSAEEEVARDFLCFGGADAAVVVCDATCLERSLNLALQIMEMTDKVIICVNLMDEARKKGIRIELPALEAALGVPVVGTTARSKKGLDDLLQCISDTVRGVRPCTPVPARYTAPMESAVRQVTDAVRPLCAPLSPRWLAVKLLCGDQSALQGAAGYLGRDIAAEPAVSSALRTARDALEAEGIDVPRLRDLAASCPVLWAEGVAADAVAAERDRYDARDRRLDRLFTSRLTGIPIMLLLLFLVFWLTIAGANLPSQWLQNRLFAFQDVLSGLFVRIGAPDWLHGLLVLGAYRVLAWVVSVMLPPMAIFFPLFTLLEDFGYLPRVAFNLDHFFKRACACGKQSLSMCMGFGCNAAGVTGCRIIDSPRERLIAIITNSLVPCNGRFPTMITLISLFFIGAAGLGATLASALLLTGVIVLGVLMTFACSRFLSRTLLRGVPSSFALELPPYRRPQVGRVIIRSVLDRTLFVLARAAAVAAPAGLVIWLLANITVGDASLLAHVSGFLDPFARLFGLDGVILLAFILGFPANEIVLPIAIMVYTASGSLPELGSSQSVHALLAQNGWTAVTALCTILFSLFHWPCSTTCLTIKKETGSLRWTAVSILLPTAIGFAVCFIVANGARLLGLA